MVDLGFGLLDKRTVIVIVLTMAASQALFGNEFPIHGPGAVEILSDLIILTGFFYLARSIYRLPIAFLFHLFYLTSASSSFAYVYSPEWLSKLGGKNIFWRAYYVILTSGVVLLRLPINLLKFGEWVKVEYKTEPVLFQFYDRLGLIGIAFLATLPGLRSQIFQFGVAGIVMMIVIYLFRGTFTSFVVDLLDDLANSKYHKKNREKPLG